MALDLRKWQPAFWTTERPNHLHRLDNHGHELLSGGDSTCTTNNYKVAFKRHGFGQHYGTGLDYVQLTDSVSETLGTTFYRDVVNAQNTNYNLLPIFKTTLARRPMLTVRNRPGDSSG